MTRESEAHTSYIHLPRDGISLRFTLHREHINMNDFSTTLNYHK